MIPPLYGVPETLVRGFVLIEDRRFFYHGGVDWIGVARAALANVRAMRFAQGGSTITQQLARMQYRLPPQKTLSRKWREMKLARTLERKYSKGEILAQYLRVIYLGPGVRGVYEAAKHYFGKDVSELTLAEQATLIGLARSPARYSPAAHPVRAELRKLTVMNAMVRAGLVSE